MPWHHAAIYAMTATAAAATAAAAAAATHHYRLYRPTDRTLARSVISNYVPILGVLYWYSTKEGHGCCNGPNVEVECAIHIRRISLHIGYTDVLSRMPLLYSGEVRVSAGTPQHSQCE